MSPVKIPSRAEYLLLAKVAEEAERYEDLVGQIKGLTYTYGALNIEERNLLSVAYKNITNTLRSSWRIVDTLEKMESSRASIRQVSLIRRQRSRIEQELADTCKDIVKLLDERLLPSAKQGEEKVFYYKMKGDYYRYLAEFAQQHDRSHFAELSLSAYKFSYKHALATLDPMHPTRLGLALNFAVYYHDVLKSPERACHLGKHAFDEAVSCLDESSSGQVMRDSMMILQLLRDDLIIWSGEMQKELDDR
ncbi:hypothetical protein SERLADRAFT_435677 [Serpula lacrymans var. lacrymans S7.9]|uniref:14-3-3 domain-containing protein n=1 Tax=Serpula lacrymans var. lacrymans (strain S7.9) TaxID=578457 RepID=F8NMT1_SERL9|nr:uncharacterized protein SERLADRAFT_435677 [Serpula lacrymans var. lacrymans S7.9]EGO27907.1 hypothetical protein SERLADRAFT_435677 [Serpula lacrymans var. lacrymans S7.9]